MTSIPSNSSAFELLDDRIKRWIWKEGWQELRTGQELVIPLVLDAKHDVILAAPTSTGKTEAAFLPILTKLAANPPTSVGAIYISPLKALINDQFRRLDALSEVLNIAVHRWHGDVSQAAKNRLLSAPSGILLITPESLEALFVNQGSKLQRVFGQLQYAVIDELHAFLGTERGAQLRSLLHRLDTVTGRSEVRIGLSATLADLRPAAEFLRGADPANVKTVSTEGSAGINAQIRAYLNPPEANTELPLARDQIVAHLHEKFRDDHHLVFANARAKVEEYADALSELSRIKLLPDIFTAHHGNLSKELREEAEERLRDDSRPTVCVCTSTLELGIDIGAMQSVAQIGPPPSVTSLRQRVGRSGRRGEPSVLRMYASEQPSDELIDPADQLRPLLLREIACLELMLEGWYEPPNLSVPHLSTLVQQVMSIIVERGGASISHIFKTLCRKEAFSAVDRDSFLLVLRSMKEKALIRQMDDGTLLLDKKGERIVSHYSFYAAFETKKEFRLLHGSRTLGTIPVESILRINDHLLFAGKRWKVIDIDDERRVVLVEPSAGARLPRFSGAAGEIHGRVRERIRALLEREDVPAFLSLTAKSLLAEARAAYRRLALDRLRLMEIGSDTLIFHWSGDREALTLALLLTKGGIQCELGELEIIAKSGLEAVREGLRAVIDAPEMPLKTLLSYLKNKRQNKYDWVLSEDLLDVEFAARALDVPAALQLARSILGSDSTNEKSVGREKNQPRTQHHTEPRLEVLDGHTSIGGTKILLSQGGVDLLLDFGLDFKRYGTYFEEFLRPRSSRGLVDLWHFNLIPHLDGVYRQDLMPLGEQFVADRPANLCGILLSHAHVDHFGMIGTLRSDIPIHASPESLAIIKASQDTGRIDFWGEAVYCKIRGSADRDSRALRVQDEKYGRPVLCIGDAPETLRDLLHALPSDEGTKNLVPGPIYTSTGTVGPFTYQSWAVDHSLPGCLAFRIDSELGSIVYTGDLRRHGALGGSTDSFVADAATSRPDLLICEGTQVTRDTPNVTTEDTVKTRANEIVEGASGRLVIADFGPRHVERLSSFLEIAVSTQRRLVITTKDAYLLTSLAAANPTFNLLASNRIVIYDEVRAAASIWEVAVKEQFSDRLVDSREIRKNQGWYILAFSFFDCNELVDIRPNEAVYIYSGSEAYSEDQVQDMRRLWAWCRDEFNMSVHGFNLEGGKLSFPDPLNASGHATRQDIEWLIESIRPRKLLPVHRSDESQKWFTDLAIRLGIELVGPVVS